MIKKIIAIVFFGFFVLSGLYYLIFLQKKSNLKTLNVLTYSSFSGLYGPGREIQKQFEKNCSCQIEWFLVEDSTALLQRLHILPFIDVVIGFDQMQLSLFASRKWKTIDLKNILLDPSINSWKTHFFIPIDWSPIGFIAKEKYLNLVKLQDLSKWEGKITFPEPQSSTLGLQWYYWIYTIFSGDISKISNFLKQIKEKIYGPVFSWSLAYGHFQKGRVSMSLSYLTSLMYHQKEERDSTYQFVPFKEGHPYQVEFTAIPDSCEQCFLAQSFVEFLTSNAIQETIRDKHYMFPSVSSVDKMFSFKKDQIKFISYKKKDEFLNQKEKLLKLWKEILY